MGLVPVGRKSDFAGPKLVKPSFVVVAAVVAVVAVVPSLPRR